MGPATRAFPWLRFVSSAPPGGILLAYHVDLAVDGYSEGEFTSVSDYDGTALAGMGSVGDTPVVLFDTFGYTWIGPCTPGIGD